MSSQKLSLSAIISLATLFLLAGCKEKQQAKPQVQPEINVVAAGQKTVPVFSEYVGQTYGISDVEITSRVDGWIMSIHFKEGDLVSKGQLLYVVDDQQIRTKIDESKARVTSAQSQLARATSDLARVEPLAKMNALSKRDLDAAIAIHETAKAEVDAAQAALRNAEIELGYTRITAPVSGVIGITKYQVGDYVGRGQLTGSLNTISSIGDVRVRFPFSENEWLRVMKKVNEGKTKTKQIANIPVDLILSDGTMYEEKGRLDLANREIDTETGSIIVQAIFTNKKGLIRPGQYVKVRIKTDEYPNAVMVPQQAVNQLQNIYQVFMLTDSSRLKPHVVKVGARVGSNWIITEGLKEGEKVAVVGNALLNPNMTVKPVDMAWDYESSSHN